MTDKELLELAAKAAGIVGFRYDESDLCYYISPGYTFWNPLTNDGDALRLAVKLGFSICNNNSIGASWICNNFGENISEVAHDDAVEFCPHTATRRAIVRAAAEIGKGMK